MSAPQSAYSTKTFELHNVGVVKYENLIALKLLEYGVDTKALFYLDLLFIVQNGLDVGFIGAMRIGGGKEILHNTARWSKGRLKDGSGNVYIMLNDAGLNTLGICSLGTPYTEFGSGVKVIITYKTAYYVDTDGLKLRYQINGGAWSEYFVSGNIDRENEGSFLAGINDAGGINPGDQISVQALNINDEGTFSSEIQSFIVPKPSLIMSSGTFGSTAYANFSSNINRATYYFSELSLEVGTRMFVNESETVNAQPGYYANDDIWIKTAIQGAGTPEEYCIIVSSGTVGSWDSEDPATPATMQPITFVATGGITGNRDWVWTCANMQFAIPYSCYLVIDTKRYVTTNSPLGEPVADGIYYLDSFNFIVIKNGYKTNDGNCNDGIIEFPIIDE